MTALVSVAARLDNAMEALEPLMTAAVLNADAAFARRQFSAASTEIVAAKRLINSLIGSAALAQRRQYEAPAASLSGLIVIDGAPDIGTTLQGERVLVTFERAARIQRNPWPPAGPEEEGADSEGGELCRAL